MIVCECLRCSHISNRHNMRNLCTLVMFSHTTRIPFATLNTCVDTMCFSITRDTYVNLYLLNCLNLFLKYKIGYTCLACLWMLACFAYRVKVWFECLTCCLDACLSNHLVAFSSYVFFPLEKPLFCILDSFSTECQQIPLLSRFLGLISTAS